MEPEIDGKNAKMNEIALLTLKTYALMAVREIQNRSVRSFMKFLKDWRSHIQIV